MWMILPHRKVPFLQPLRRLFPWAFRAWCPTSNETWGQRHGHGASDLLACHHLHLSSPPPPVTFELLITSAQDLPAGCFLCWLWVSPSQWDYKILEGRDHILSSFSAQTTPINFAHGSAGGEEKEVVGQMGSDATLALKGPSRHSGPLCPDSQQPDLLSLPLAPM